MSPNDLRLDSAFSVGPPPAPFAMRKVSLSVRTEKTLSVRGWMTNIRSIDDRPDEVRQRTCLEHYEGDTVVLERGVRALVTLVDRKSRFLIAEFIDAAIGISYEVHESLVSRLAPLPHALRQTITPDRGSEFSHWDMTEKEISGLLFYFPRAVLHGNVERTSIRTNCFVGTSRRMTNMRI